MMRTLVAIVTMLAVVAVGAVVVRQFALGDDPVPAAVAAAAAGDLAPSFVLTDQDGREVALADLGGKVVVVSFVFTRCADICPVAIYKLVWIQDELGARFGRDVGFVTITIDPEHDTAPVLAEYADQVGADPAGWRFLTGPEKRIREITRRYGVYAKPDETGSVNHILLTSLVDRDGVIRLQYLGERFDAKEMLADLRALLDEEAR